MALTAEPKNGPVLLSPCRRSGILVQPPARRPDVSLYRLGTEPVFFDRAQSMDPQARKTKCRLNTLLTSNPSCEVSGSPTGSRSPPTRRPRHPKPPPPEPSGHHQHSAIALLFGPEMAAAD